MCVCALRNECVIADVIWRSRSRTTIFQLQIAIACGRTNTQNDHFVGPHRQRNGLKLVKIEFAGTREHTHLVLEHFEWLRCQNKRTMGRSHRIYSATYAQMPSNYFLISIWLQCFSFVSLFGLFFFSCAARLQTTASVDNKIENFVVAIDPESLPTEQLMETKTE